MEFTALFLAATTVMIAVWRGPRSLALTLFAGACAEDPVACELLKH
jgi:hypothetical protein